MQTQLLGGLDRRAGRPVEGQECCSLENEVQGASGREKGKMRDRGETRKLTETGVWNWGAGSEGREE